MREVTFGDLSTLEQHAQALRDIEGASREDALPIVDGFTIGTFTTLRALPSTGTATLADVVNVLSTLIDDLQKRGPNRVE